MRFIDNNDGTITDAETNLMWQKKFKKLTWGEAIKYAAKLNLGGHMDWRLPTIKQLFTLINYNKYNPASDFPKIKGDCYFWSSSSHVDDDSFAWVVDFEGGEILYNDKDNFNYICCVRSKLKKISRTNDVISVRKKSLIDIFQKEFK